MCVFLKLQPKKISVTCLVNVEVCFYQLFCFIFFNMTCIKFVDFFFILFITWSKVTFCLHQVVRVWLQKIVTTENFFFIKSLNSTHQAQSLRERVERKSKLVFFQALCGENPWVLRNLMKKLLYSREKKVGPRENKNFCTMHALCFYFLTLKKKNTKLIKSTPCQAAQKTIKFFLILMYLYFLNCIIIFSQNVYL